MIKGSNGRSAEGTYNSTFSNVMTASNTIQLTQYLGKRVKVKGAFMYYGANRIKNCRITPVSSGVPVVVFEIKEIQQL